MHGTNRAATLMRDAESQGFAVPAFNVHNYEFIQGTVTGTRQAQGRCLLEVGPKSLRFIALPVWYRLARAVAEAADMDIPVHLDHCPDVAVCLEAVTLGFDSVMFDGSHLPLEENIRLTRAVVAQAHAADVLVEGEIGPITHDIAQRVSVRDIERYVDETQIDWLASGFGTEHGQRTDGLDLDRIEQLRQLKVPLVLHGSSGVPFPLLQDAIQAGIRKVNIGTALNQAFLEAVGTARDKSDPRVLLNQGTDAVAAVCAEYCHLLGRKTVQ